MHIKTKKFLSFFVVGILQCKFKKESQVKTMVPKDNIPMSILETLKKPFPKPRKDVSAHTQTLAKALQWPPGVPLTGGGIGDALRNPQLPEGVRGQIRNQLEAILSGGELNGPNAQIFGAGSSKPILTHITGTQIGVMVKYEFSRASNPINEVIAYKLATLTQLYTVPPVVLREVGGHPVSVHLFLEGAQNVPGERPNDNTWKFYLISGKDDYLISGKDDIGGGLIERNGVQWSVDNSQLGMTNRITPTDLQRFSVSASFRTSSTFVRDKRPWLIKVGEFVFEFFVPGEQGFEVGLWG